MIPAKTIKISIQHIKIQLPKQTKKKKVLKIYIKEIGLNKTDFLYIQQWYKEKSKEERNAAPPLTIFFPKSGNELLWCYAADLLLLGGNVVEEVSQAGQEGLLRPLVLGFVFQDLFPERLTKIECL